MKASVSSVWLVGLVIIFLMVFSAYIIITTDYSKSFKLKNEVLTIIEKNKGMTVFSGNLKPSTINPSVDVLTRVGTIKTINAYLAAHNYDARGTCDIPNGTTAYGVTALEYDADDGWGNIGEQAERDESYFYCFAKFPTGNINIHSSIYYRVELFYKFEIPILRELLHIRVDGVTDEIYNASPDDTFIINSRDYFTVIGG